MQFLTCLLGVSGILLIAAGCGGSGRPSLVKVTGKITVDGQPVEGALVAMQLITDEKSKYQRPSSATTNAEGEFTPRTYGPEDGLPLGKYRIGIQKRELVGELPKDFNAENPDAYNLRYKWLTPREYADPQSSGLEVEVTSSGLEPAVIDLKTNGRRPEIELTGPQRRANDP